MVLAETLEEAQTKAFVRKAKDLLLHIKKEEIAELDNKTSVFLASTLYNNIKEKKNDT